MPQMAPINWLILFLMFSISFFIFNILNYYCFNYLNNNFKNKINIFKNKMIISWKW